MNASSWSKCEDPTAMIHFLDGLASPPSERKLWLYVAACRRLLNRDAIFKNFYQIFQFAERGERPPDEAVQAIAAFARPTGTSVPNTVSGQVSLIVELVGRYGVSRQQRANALRDIIGDPFTICLVTNNYIVIDGKEAPTIPPSCLTPDVVRMALQAYVTQDFSSAPILADALEEAGCQEGGIGSDYLLHLRGSQHFRGCWAIDVILLQDRT